MVDFPQRKTLAAGFCLKITLKQNHYFNDLNTTASWLKSTLSLSLVNIIMISIDRWDQLQHIFVVPQEVSYMELLASS